MRKFLTLLAVLAVCCAFLLVPALGADVVESGDCGEQGDNVTWTLDSDGLLTISGTGKTANYLYQFQDRSDIKRVVVKEGVTFLGNRAFAGCSNLESVSLPDGLIFLGYSAFEDCRSLTEIEIPEGIETIEEWTFGNCTSLQSVTIPSTVTWIRAYAFDCCENLSEIEIPEGVETISQYAFSECTGLTSVTIPAGVTTIGERAFSWCEALTAIEVAPSNQNYCSVGGVLYTKDKSILVQYPTGKVDAVYEIPNGVTTIGERAIYQVQNLRELVLPEGLTTIKRQGIAYCRNLQTLNLPASLATLEEEAIQCYNLDTLTVDEDNENFAAEDGALLSKDMTVMYLYTGGNRAFYAIPATVTTVENSAFRSNSNLKSVSVPASVNDLGNTPFQYCYNLTAINVDEDNETYASENGVLFTKDVDILIKYPCAKDDLAYEVPETVTSIVQGAFQQSSKLKVVTIPEGVIEVGGEAFSDCESLLMVVLPESVEILGNHAFNYCDNMTAVYLPASLIDVEWQGFYGCTVLTDIYFGGTEEQWNTINQYDRIQIPEGATLHLDAAIPELPEIVETSWSLSADGTLTVTGAGPMKDYDWDEYAPWYDRAEDVKKIVIDPRFTTIGAYAFYEMYNATEIVIPEGITSIGESGLGWCESLTSLTLPASLTHIGYDALSALDNVEQIVIPKNVTTIEEGAFWMNGVTQFKVQTGSQNFSSGDGVLFNKDKTRLVAYPGRNARTSYTIPASVTVVDQNAFGYNHTLQTLSVHANVTDLGDRPFYWDQNMVAINVNANNKNYCSVNGILYNKAKTELIHVPSHSTVTSYTIPNTVVSIADAAICGNDTMTTLTLGSGVASIGNQGITSCEVLTAIKVNVNNKTYAGKDGVLFSKDMSTLIMYPPARTAASYTVPAGVKIIAKDAISENGNLQSVVISEGVTDLERSAFSSCWNMTSVTLPSTLKSIGERAFAYCNNLDNVEIPSGLTSIGDRAFQRCRAMTSIKIPASVQYIGVGAFYACNEMTDIYFAGTEKQWNNATGGTDKVADDNVIVHFNGSTSSVTLKAPTTLEVGRRVSDGKPIMNWTAVTGATNYEVQVSVDGVNWSKLITTSKLSVAHTGAVAGNSYYYRVRATNNSGKGPFTQAWRTRCALPQPAITVTTSASSGKPVISWKAVEGASGYEVWRCGTSGGTYTRMFTTKDPTKLSVTHTGAVVGETYFYKVVATHAKEAANSAMSAAKGVWCDLARPTVTVKNHAATGKPTISWTAVEGATGYEVYRCGTSGGTYSKLISTTKLSVTHTGAAVGNDYFYKVKALYGPNASCNSALTTAKGVWVDLPQPTVKVLNSISTGKPVIQWEKVDYAVKYKVYVAESSGGTYKLLYTTPDANKLSVTHTGAKAENDYFYKVVAVHKSSKCNSAMSAAKGVWVDLARPTMNVSLNAKNKPYLTWSKVEGADKYQVYVSANGGAYKLLYTAAADDFDVTHTNVVPGNTYTYKVRAVSTVNSKANSSYSVVKTVDIP